MFASRWSLLPFPAPNRARTWLDPGASLILRTLGPAPPVATLGPSRSSHRRTHPRAALVMTGRFAVDVEVIRSAKAKPPAALNSSGSGWSAVLGAALRRWSAWAVVVARGDQVGFFG